MVWSLLKTRCFCRTCPNKQISRNKDILCKCSKIMTLCTCFNSASCKYILYAYTYIYIFIYWNFLEESNLRFFVFLSPGLNHTASIQNWLNDKKLLSNNIIEDNWWSHGKVGKAGVDDGFTPIFSQPTPWCSSLPAPRHTFPCWNCQHRWCFPRTLWDLYKSNHCSEHQKEKEERKKIIKLSVLQAC